MIPTKNIFNNNEYISSTLFFLICGIHKLLRRDYSHFKNRVQRLASVPILKKKGGKGQTKKCGGPESDCLLSASRSIRGRDLHVRLSSQNRKEWLRLKCNNHVSPIHYKSSHLSQSNHRPYNVIAISISSKVIE